MLDLSDQILHLSNQILQQKNLLPALLHLKQFRIIFFVTSLYRFYVRAHS